jgi:hypothetical protein
MVAQEVNTVWPAYTTTHIFIYRHHKFRKYTMDGIEFLLVGLNDFLPRIHGYSFDKVILMDNLKWDDLPLGFAAHIRTPIQLEFPF